jgi:MFS family permease
MPEIGLFHQKKSLLVVVGSFIILFITFGSRYSYGLFVKPLISDFGWSTAYISAAASINIFIYSLVGIIAGIYIDNFRPRKILSAAIIINSLGFFLISFLNSGYQLILFYGILCGIGSAGSGAVTTSSIIGKYFTNAKGKAIGISTTGISVGILGMAPIAGYLIENYDWRFAYKIFSIIIFVTGMLSTSIFFPKYSSDFSNESNQKNKNSIIIKNQFKKEYNFITNLLKTDSFWHLVICNGFAVFTVMMTFVHQVPYSLDLGYDKYTAAGALGTIGLISCFGKFFFGWFSDRIQDAKFAACFGFISMAVGTLFLIVGNRIIYLYIFSFLFGFGYGSLAPLMPYLISDRFGDQFIGTGYGILTFFVTGVFGTLGPIVGGLIYDFVGSYRYAWMLNTTILFSVSILIITLKPKKVKIV